MTAARVCSECGEAIPSRDPKAKTCSDKCRATRSRRLRREGVEQERSEAEVLKSAVGEVVRERAKDVAHEKLEEALQPVLREAITEETFQAIADLVKLAPDAVTALKEDLLSDDAGIRQRAYTLVVKYTIGHPALVRAEEDDKPPALTVNFGIPRPPVADVEATATELPAPGTRTCDRCGDTKPEDEFVQDSTRCQQCWADQQAEVQERFGDVEKGPEA